MTPEEAERTALALGHLVARVDGRQAPDQAALLAQLAAGLRFPDYFGGNLDALDECLRDLSDFAPAPGYLILVAHAAEACPGRRADLADVLICLRDAQRHWNAQTPPTPFRVVVSD